jgi:hypothetical protein
MSQRVHVKVLTITGQGTVDVPIQQFTSTNDAIAQLGESEALKMLNYSHELRQRNFIREGQCPQCGTRTCGFFNRPYCCGR